MSRRGDHRMRSTIQPPFWLTLVLSLAVGLAGPLCLPAAAPASRTPDPDASMILEAVLRGIDARGEAVRSQIGVMKGLWQVDTARRKYPSPTHPPDDVDGTRLERRSAREFAVLSGEKYRAATREISAQGDGRLTVSGYDGRSAWVFESIHPKGSRLHETTRAAPSDLRVALLTGLQQCLSYAAEDRLGAYLRRVGAGLVSEDIVDGRLCYVVECHPPVDTEPTEMFWVCPDYGYAVVRVSRAYQSPKGRTRRYHYRAREDYSRFQEHAPDVWLPHAASSATEIGLGDGTWAVLSHESADAVYLKTNVLLAPEEFDVPEDLREQLDP